MNTTLVEWAKTTLYETIKKGGKLVPQEQGDARVEVCKGCEKYGKVEPLPGIISDGCTVCGCPSDTKPYMLNYITLTGKKLIECPHPTEGNKWKVIDEQFKTLSES